MTHGKHYPPADWTRSRRFVVTPKGEDVLLGKRALTASPLTDEGLEVLEAIECEERRERGMAWLFPAAATIVVALGIAA